MAVTCRAVVPDSLQPCGLQPVRLLLPWNSPGKNTGVGCHSRLQGIFPTQGYNLGLLHCRQEISLPSEPPGKPNKWLNLCLIPGLPDFKLNVLSLHLPLMAHGEVWNTT